MPIAIAVGVYRIPGASLDRCSRLSRSASGPPVTQQVHEGVGAHDRTTTRRGSITATSASVCARPESRLIQSATGNPISRQSRVAPTLRTRAPQDRVDVQPIVQVAVVVERPAPVDLEREDVDLGRTSRRRAGASGARKKMPVQAKPGSARSVRGWSGECRRRSSCCRSVNKLPADSYHARRRGATALAVPSGGA